MFNSWVGKIPWRRKWQPTPRFLSGKSYGQRTLAGYSPWGKESDMTEKLTHNTYLFFYLWNISVFPPSPPFLHPNPMCGFFYANILDFYWFLSEESSAMGISTGNSNAGISASLICMNSAWTLVQNCICVAHLSCSRRVPLKTETSIIASLSRWRTFLKIGL